MYRIIISISWFLVITHMLVSCGSSKNVSTKFYFKNQPVLDSMQSEYKRLYLKRPFALQFTDRTFTTVSIDLITDSIKYVYVFGVNEKLRMDDTLKRFGLDIAPVNQLIEQMRSIRCNWINLLDYYVNRRLQYMTFISIRQLRWRLPFVPAKYYIVTYFARPQYFDKEGRLLDGRRLKIVRKINGDIFRRINDSVCYTVSNKFR